MFLDKLEKDGWVEVDGVSSPEGFISLAKNIGVIIPHPNGKPFNVLKPSNGKESIKGTFSSIYGYEKFPLHTDTAFWPKPARYIVMGALKEDENSTFIVNTESVFNNLSSRAKSAAKTATYKVKTPSGVHFTSFIFNDHSSNGYRFDPCCMRPANESAEYFNSEFNGVLGEVKPNEIDWSGNKAIIMDNWNTMHGRSAIMDATTNRELLRIYVG